MICKTAYDKKAEEIVVMEMSQRSTICEYFILMSAPSTVRVKTIVDHIEETLEKNEDLRVRHKEGYRDGQWVLMDYGAVIVHVFYDGVRKFYDIENLWGDAPKKKYLNHGG